MNKALFLGVIAVVLAALLAGLAVVGGPGHARAEKRDNRRHDDLQRLAEALICPAEPRATRMRGCPAAPPALTDPSTGAPYAVSQEPLRLEICARFELAGAEAGAPGHWRDRLHFDGSRGCLRYSRAGEGEPWLWQPR